MLIMPNKLIRDKVTDIIYKSGKIPFTYILDNLNYIKELDRKLIEELEEYQSSKTLEELADIVEVIYAIVLAKGYSIEQLEKIRLEKLTRCGGFEKKIYLYKIENAEPNEK